MKKFGYIKLLRDDVRFWHKLYFKVAGVSPDHKLRFMYFEKILNEIAPGKDIHSILDAGCGSGDYSFYLSERFPEARIRSIDIDGDRVNNNIKLAEKLNVNNIRFELQDISYMQDREKYDLICCIDVLEHMPDPSLALSNLLSSLKNDGLLYIHMPLKKARPVVFNKFLKDFHEWAEEEHLADDFTKNEFLDLIRSNKEAVVQFQQPSFNHYLGELCVSLIMLFYKNNMICNVSKACLSPFMHLLINMDIAIKNKEGNAIAVLLQKKINAVEGTGDASAPFAARAGASDLRPLAPRNSLYPEGGSPLPAPPKRSVDRHG